MRQRKYVLPLAGALGVAIIGSSALAFGFIGTGHPGTTPTVAAPSQHFTPTPGHGLPEGETVVGPATSSTPYAGPSAADAPKAATGAANAATSSPAAIPSTGATVKSTGRAAGGGHLGRRGGEQHGHQRSQYGQRGPRRRHQRGERRDRAGRRGPQRRHGHRRRHPRPGDGPARRLGVGLRLRHHGAAQQRHLPDRLADERPAHRPPVAPVGGGPGPLVAALEPDPDRQQPAGPRPAVAALDAAGGGPDQPLLAPRRLRRPDGQLGVGRSARRPARRRVRVGWSAGRPAREQLGLRRPARRSAGEQLGQPARRLERLARRRLGRPAGEPGRRGRPRAVAVVPAERPHGAARRPDLAAERAADRQPDGAARSPAGGGPEPPERPGQPDVDGVQPAARGPAVPVEPPPVQIPGSLL